MCSSCNDNCFDFEEQICVTRFKPPYVCNSCPERNRCTLEKTVYYAAKAHAKAQAHILSLVARILITIAIEMGIALLFGFRGKKALLLLVIVNTVTQIILNVLLNIINFRSGSWAFVAWYIMLELAIFAIEAALYTAFMKKLTGKEKPVLFYGAYSLVAKKFNPILCWKYTPVTACEVVMEEADYGIRHNSLFQCGGKLIAERTNDATENFGFVYDRNELWLLRDMTFAVTRSITYGNCEGERMTYRYFIGNDLDCFRKYCEADDILARVRELIRENEMMPTL